MISLPAYLVKRIIELLQMIALMKPDFEVYEFSKQLTIDIHEELKKHV